MAAYSELEVYYYTEDHIGRPLSLRDDNQDLRWYEQHYPFGEIIDEDTPNGSITAGAGAYQISWKPNFRFPGQYEDTDMFTFAQNHFREYLPQFGRYNRNDPKSRKLLYRPSFQDVEVYCYCYSGNNPITTMDALGCETIIDEEGNLWGWNIIYKSRSYECRCYYRYRPKGDLTSYIWSEPPNQPNMEKTEDCYKKCCNDSTTDENFPLADLTYDCCYCACENQFKSYKEHDAYRNGSYRDRLNALVHFGWR